MKRKLEKPPTRALMEGKRKVQMLWRRISKKHSSSFCIGMKRRINAAKKANGICQGIEIY